MRKICLAHLAFALLFFLIPSRVFAFEIKGLQPVQPYWVFSSFSAETLPPGAFASGMDYDNVPDDSYQRLALKAGYGIADNMDTILTVPYILEYKESEGWEDIALGFRHKVFGEGKYGPSVAYLVKLSLPNGIDEFSTDGAFGAGVIVSKKLGPFSSNINFFYSEPFESAYNEQLEFSFGLALKASHDFDILGELYVIDSYRVKSFETVEARLGYRVRTEYVYTTIGAGFDLKNRTPDFRIMLSLNLLLEKHRKVGY